MSQDHQRSKFDKILPMRGLILGTELIKNFKGNTQYELKMYTMN